MNLISLQFLVFCIALLVLYYLVPKRFQWWLLLLGSAVFFLLTGTPYTIIYLLISIVSAWLAGRYIQTQNNRRRKRAVFIAEIILNVGMLAALKYTNFLLSTTESLVNLFGANLSLGTVSWVSAIGISFYTLQVVGYLCDVYWGISQAQRNPFKFALFVSYFPQISSGPISRYHQLEELLFAGHGFDHKTVTFGLQRMLWGFFKKLVIAERLTAFVNSVYGAPHTYQGAYIWLGTVAFLIQLYADFSGNMDIVLGLSESLGIRLTENFRAPLFARNVQAFWQRWHITLGAWFKDYVMFPILRSRAWAKMGRRLKTRFGKNTARRIPAWLGMLVLWVGIGIWHGNGWQFIFQGLWFFCIIVLGQLCAPLFDTLRRKLCIREKSFIWHLFQSLRTCLLFAVGLVFFRAQSLNHAFGMLFSAVTVFNPGAIFSVQTLALLGGWENLRIVLPAIALLLFVDVLHARGNSLRAWAARQNIALRWVLYYALLFAVLLFGMYGGGYSPGEFIYGGF
ncbi:MAG: MBOAT family protein [Clostridiales bacterium]|nr:MBOAT family protein [Clostridiales bacterium]